MNLKLFFFPRDSFVFVDNRMLTSMELIICRDSRRTSLALMRRGNNFFCDIKEQKKAPECTCWHMKTYCTTFCRVFL